MVGGLPVLLHHGGATALLLLGYSFVFWTPSFFERVHGLAAEKASVYFGLIFIFSGVSGCLFYAWLSQRRFDGGTLDAALLVPMLSSLVLLPIIGLIQVVPSLPWVFALYVPAMFLINSPYGLLQGAMIQIAPPEIRARVAAVYMMFSALGNAIGPSIVGILNDGTFTVADGIRYSMLVMCGIFGIGGVLLLAMSRGRFAKRLTEVLEGDRAQSFAKSGRFFSFRSFAYVPRVGYVGVPSPPRLGVECRQFRWNGAVLAATDGSANAPSVVLDRWDCRPSR